MTTPRRIVIAHVPYQALGGEDVHVRMLEGAYRSLGHAVQLVPATKRAPSLRETARSLAGGSSVLHEELAPLRPDVVHLHNAFPLLGPAFFRWAIESGTKVVMTVHNHRLYCTNGLAFRDGHDCDDCLGKRVPLPSLLHNCNDAPHKTLYHFTALTQMHVQHLYTRAVRRFIAPSPYVAGWLPRAGVDPTRVTLLHHAVDWAEGDATPISDVLYAGRLSQEKGVRVLLEAVKRLPEVRFVVAGAGPLSADVESAAVTLPNLKYLGRVPSERVRELLRECRVTAFPSECREIAPLFVLETFVAGRRCVIAKSESTRWLLESAMPAIGVESGSAESLARGLEQALKLPLPASQQVADLRARFGAERFTRELGVLIDEVVRA